MSPRAARKRKDNERKQHARKRISFRDHAKHRKPGDAHTIPSFCLSNAISESFYFKLKRQGLQPVEMEIDGIIRISPEAERDWRAENEAESKAKREQAKRLRERATAQAPP